MIGKSVSHYQITEKLGEGGMGIVYKAEDTKLKRTVALKFLPQELTRDPGAKARFIREAQAASSLDHPNICTIHEIDETADGQLFIVMACYEGQTLKQMLNTPLNPPLARGETGPSPLPVNKAIDIMIQIAGGLAKAHVKGIVHRDIKPANIFVANDGIVKILDFGLAKLAGQAQLTKETSTLGTARYMSPEQVSGNEVDQRSDIWSLGVVFYEMLSGQPPFKGDYEQAVLYSILNEQPRPITSYRPDIPAKLITLIQKTLAKNPDDRYQTMSDLIIDLKGFAAKKQEGVWKFTRLLKKPGIAVPALLTLALLIFLSFHFYHHHAKAEWARKIILPQINQLVDLGIEDYRDAYQLAVEAEKYIPQDSELVAIFKKISVTPSILTEPPGAAIFVQRYDSLVQDWQFLAITPIEKIRMPIGFFRFRMEKEGYETVLAASPSFILDLVRKDVFVPIKLERKLDQEGKIPSGMVRIPGAIINNDIKIDDFFMDQYEVTNKQYKEFIDLGGYQKRAYWQNKFIKDGKEYPWEQAIKEFVDLTGRPGPAPWQAGDYPEGSEDYPVSGISWYEAAAFAEFAGKSLPSGVHWSIARGAYTPTLQNMSFSTYFSPQSNFKGKGPEPVGSNPAITPFGLFDMGGNVREWCWNQTQKGRLIRGGAWDDIPYMFGNYSQLSPFDRSPKNGFRCVRYIVPEHIPPGILAPIDIEESVNYYKVKPVPDPIFKIYRDQFDYDQSDLNARIEWKNERDRDWIQEKISIDAAYEKERVVLYLFLPKNTTSPYQTVIYFPTASSEMRRSSKNMELYFEFQGYLSALVKNGRAVVYPIYKGTFERGDETLSGLDENSHQYTEYFIKMVKDLKKSIDYLETRPDIDSGKLAYLGISWGAKFGTIIPAVEERLKVSVLNVGGLWDYGRPEIQPINYVGRIKIPTLMLNGRYDLSFSYELSVKPMFDLLGTAPDQKELKLYPCDHIIPRTEFIKETLNWLDTYLGPVHKELSH